MLPPKYIKPEEQMILLERLYRSQDSITSTKKFNDEYGDNIGRLGVEMVLFNEVYRRLQVAFPRIKCRQALKEITGFEPTVY
ncbi:MAG: hypothetical protein COX77_02840 [Candidatus Komeilibacteria bacterium CG_4_10_14_0_2_um_filter_37_10]|uniref:Uncharacterized protein n=1 Tax=Candidatus Komeilibacteria bacterium CG_4_10_14_0_2_um_filter_37_10 TaxID=1974470 RepID=A0A2M7VF22_9BACT|nr:MAG: hypothetical protein COX77_02840 [Candidatus Komeilibacteria bacterium CG_4_10_14_0_2_um_filter_37_10]